MKSKIKIKPRKFPGATRPTPCAWKCKAPAPSTFYVRDHPFNKELEIRKCPDCLQKTAYPKNKV